MIKKIVPREFWLPVNCPVCHQLIFFGRASACKDRLDGQDYVEFLDRLPAKETEAHAYHTCYHFYQNEYLKTRPFDYLLKKTMPELRPNLSWTPALRGPITPHLLCFYAKNSGLGNGQNWLVSDNGQIFAVADSFPYASGQLVERPHTNLGPIEKTTKLLPVYRLPRKVAPEKLSLLTFVIQSGEERKLDFEVEKILKSFETAGIRPWALIPLPKITEKPEIDLGGAAFEPKVVFRRKVFLFKEELAQNWLETYVFSPSIQISFSDKDKKIPWEVAEAEFQPQVCAG